MVVNIPKMATPLTLVKEKTMAKLIILNFCKCIVKPKIPNFYQLFMTNSCELIYFNLVAVFVYPKQVYWCTAESKWELIDVLYLSIPGAYKVYTSIPGAYKIK